MSSSSASRLKRLAMAWSNRRPCAESSITFRPGPRSRPDGFHRQENRLGLEHHAFAAAERPVVHGLVAVAWSNRAGCGCGYRGCRRPGPASPRHARTAPRRTRERSSAHGRSRPVQFLQSLGQFHRDAPGLPGRSPRRSARTKGISRPPSTTSSPQPPPSCQPVTRPRLAPVRRSDHFAAHQVGLEKLAGLQRRALARWGSRTSAPARRSASEMVSTPRNLKISVSGWNQVAPLRSAGRRAAPARNRYTSPSAW